MAWVKALNPGVERELHVPQTQPTAQLNEPEFQWDQVAWGQVPRKAGTLTEAAAPTPTAHPCEQQRLGGIGGLLVAPVLPGGVQTTFLPTLVQVTKGTKMLFKQTFEANLEIQREDPLAPSFRSVFDLFEENGTSNPKYRMEMFTIIPLGDRPDMVVCVTD